MRVITPTSEENSILAKLGESFTSSGHTPNSSMLLEERQFLNALLLREKPTKILEIGVYSGGSSAIMLNAVRHIPDSRVYGIDFMEHTTDTPRRNIGAVVDDYSELKERYTLFTGSIACSFLDQIGDGIDFCLIDTAHFLPGEILDFLMAFPYLKNGCTLIFHDTQLHSNKGVDSLATNCILLNAIKGERLTPTIPESSIFRETLAKMGMDCPPDFFPFPNIGGVTLDKSMEKDMLGVFTLLTLKWAYYPAAEHIALMEKHFARFYDSYCLEFFRRVTLLREFRKNTAVDIANLLSSGVPLYIYGAGKQGRAFLAMCRDLAPSLAFAGFLDASPALAGQTLDGLQVIVPEVPGSRGEQPFVITAITNNQARHDALARCEKLGYTCVGYYTFIQDYLLDIAAGPLKTYEDKYANI